MYYEALRKRLKEFESLRGKINEDKKEELIKNKKTVESKQKDLKKKNIVFYD